MRAMLKALVNNQNSLLCPFVGVVVGYVGQSLQSQRQGHQRQPLRLITCRRVCGRVFGPSTVLIVQNLVIHVGELMVGFVVSHGLWSHMLRSVRPSIDYTLVALVEQLMW